MSNFIKRTKKPEKKNKYFNTVDAGGYSLCIKGKPEQSGLNVLSNCVGYACGRFNEIIGEFKYKTFYCNAKGFINKAKKLGLEISEQPTLGGIMVFSNADGVNNNGHVCIVESILSEDEVEVSESSYGGFAFKITKRNNSNKNWGYNAKVLKYIGCVVNPKVGRVYVELKEKVDSKLKTGTYQTLYDMYVRNGSSTKSAVKKVSSLTEDGKKNATSSNPNANAIYKKGTKFDALKIVDSGDGQWAKTPSGYVCLVGKSKKVYCKKC